MMQLILLAVYQASEAIEEGLQRPCGCVRGRRKRRNPSTTTISPSGLTCLSAMQTEDKIF